MERTQRSIYAWVLTGLVAYVALPWYFLQQGSLAGALLHLFATDQTANGLMQAAVHGRAWLWCGVVGLVIAGVGAVLPAGRRQGQVLCAGALLGLIGLLVSGFSIGAGGWMFDWMARWWGPLPVGQFGVGWGGFVVLLSLVMLLGAGLARLGYFRQDVFVAACVVGCISLLAIFVVYPVGKSLLAAFVSDQGQWSLYAFFERVGTERVWGLSCLTGQGNCGVAWNTLYLALLTAAGTTVMGTLIALLAERGQTRFGRPMNGLAMLPIITPPFVVGLGLILLFGRAGVVNQWLESQFGIEPTRWFYGVFGVWVAQMFAFTPIAFMIMRGVVQGISPSLEEAAQTLHARPFQTFTSVTLPLLKPGLANAFLVGFIESIADFGNPILLGSGFPVLSTEIFFAIVGSSLDQGMAAGLALVLTAFALVVFFVQRSLLGRTSYVTVSGKGDAGLAPALPVGVRRVCLGLALPWLAFTVIVYLFAFAGGFVKVWGRDYSLTLDHFLSAFSVQWTAQGVLWSGAAWNSLFNTTVLAALAAPVCAGLGMLIAWLLARTEFRGKSAFEFAALLTFAIPGTVLGVSYILAFNVPPIELTGTGLIIVLCFVFRSLPVGVRAGTASFKQLDRSLDEASVMLRASSLTTLRRVIFPLIKPALVASLIYSFVRSMTTVSAVIFLVTAEYDLATAFIIGRVGTGDYGIALAYCTVLILLMSLAAAAIQWVTGHRKLGRRSTAPVASHP